MRHMTFAFLSPQISPCLSPALFWCWLHILVSCLFPGLWDEAPIFGSGVSLPLPLITPSRRHLSCLCDYSLVFLHSWTHPSDLEGFLCVMASHGLNLMTLYSTVASHLVVVPTSHISNLSEAVMIMSK